MCGSVLNVKQQPELEKMKVLCPVCKQQSPFGDFTPYVPETPGENTQILGGGAKPARANFGIRIMATGQVVKLTESEYLIGRRSASDKPKIQLDCPGFTTSREHLRLLRKVDGQGNVCWLVSLAKNKVNPTRIGSLALEPGDLLKLIPGTIIHLPDVTLEFIQLPD